MRKSVLHVGIGAAYTLLSIGPISAAEPVWQDVKALPFIMQDGLEIARHPNGKTPASLYLACSQQAGLHLILSTRLPAPRWSIASGSQDNVVLFIGDIHQQLKLAMRLVNKGQDLTWLETIVSHKGDGEPDTLVTEQLKADDIAAITLWFGDVLPSKVSVMGFAETGVFMTGTVSGAAISEFGFSCVGR